MKTSLADVSRVYRDPDMTGAAEAGPCPAPERLVACALDDLPAAERAALAAHASRCARCAGALKTLFEVERETERFAGRVRPEAAAPARRLRPLWRPAAAVLAGVFLIAAVSFAVFRLLDQSALRGGSIEGIRLISPARTSLPADAIRFSWKAAAAADAYTVEVFDASLRRVWRSDHVIGETVRLPERVAKSLTRGTSYFWWVTVVAGGRPGLKSTLAEFRIEP